MSERLSIEVLGEGGRTAELPERGRLVIGSDAGRADLVVAGQGVEGVHCAVGRLKGGGWALRDLGSEFGTFVNGERVESARLAAGDQLVIGSKRLAVVDPRASARAAAEPAPRPKVEVARAASAGEAAAKAPAPAPVPAFAGDAPPSLPGYRLDRRLGRGSMGEVWLAKQISLDRMVAIKLLSPKLEADPGFVSRFQAEARAAAALNHPNLVTVHDVGVHDGHHFLTMEFMAAGCLESRVASLGPVPWREALGILLDAARGLEYAESRRVVHRDIKPANLMQTVDGITKICDLGLAVQLEQEELESDGRRIFGTPHFIAPEVVRGARADSRSDLFSLGACAYRILSGATPFAGESTREILRAVLSDEPVPLADLVAGLPAGLSQLVARLLEKDPDRRLPSASILVRELEALRSSDGHGSLAAPIVVRRSLVVPRAVWAGFLALAGLGAWSILRGSGGPKAELPSGQAAELRADPGAAPVGEDGAPAPGEEGELDDPAGGGAVPDAGPDAVPDGGADDEAGEREQERLARDGYLALAELSLSPEERAARLRSLAEGFPGTDTARAALEEASALDARAGSASPAAEASRARLDALAQELRAAALFDADPPRPGAGLRAMAVAPGYLALAQDPGAKRLWEAIAVELVEHAVEWAEARWREAEELDAAGDFDAEERALAELTPLWDVPEGAPPAAARLVELAALAQARSESMEARRASFARERRAEDRRRVASDVRAGAGLEAELGSLDFASAHARLVALAGALHTAEARERVLPHAARVASAQRAIDALIAAWDEGRWKRLTITDPRNGRNAEVAGVSAQGIAVRSGAESALVPWSAFGGKVEALASLYLRRLDRDWSAEELGAVADLLILESIVAALAEAAPALEEEGVARFSDVDLEHLRSPFEIARSWADPVGRAEALEHERRAAERLGQTLRARTEGFWSVAAEHLARLLAEDEGSLVVLLCSDGSEWGDG